MHNEHARRGRVLVDDVLKEDHALPAPPPSASTRVLQHSRTQRLRGRLESKVCRRHSRALERSLAIWLHAPACCTHAATCYCQSKNTRLPPARQLSRRPATARWGRRRCRWSWACLAQQSHLGGSPSLGLATASTACGVLLAHESSTPRLQRAHACGSALSRPQA